MAPKGSKGVVLSTQYRQPAGVSAFKRNKMTRRVFTPEQDKEVATLYLAGLSSIQIAKHYQVDKSSVLGALQRQNVPRRIRKAKPKGPDKRFSFRSSEEAQIVKIYLANKSIEAISRAYRCKGKTIRAALVRQGVQLRKTTFNFIPKPKRPKFIPKTAIQNHTAFDTLDNEAALYYLGFTYADGSVNKQQLKFTLSTKDRVQLEKLSEFLGSQAEIRTSEIPYGRYLSQACHIEFTSKHMVNRLVELGMVSRRSHFDQLKDNIPVGLEHHFIRGYLDGDGCISNREKVIFLGQADILTWIKECLVKYAQASDKVMPYQRSGILEIAWGGRFQFRRVIDYIYKDATIYLERKKEIADKTKRG